MPPKFDDLDLRCGPLEDALKPMNAITPVDLLALKDAWTKAISRPLDRPTNALTPEEIQAAEEEWGRVKEIMCKNKNAITPEDLLAMKDAWSKANSPPPDRPAAEAPAATKSSQTNALTPEEIQAAEEEWGRVKEHLRSGFQ
jgi:hypothetical protein